jgi:hypothetical protein
MRHRLPYLLVAALAVVVPGCSYNCHFVARGVVRDAADGRPIPNARVELLDGDGRPHRLEGGGGVRPAEVTTNAQGEFEAAFSTVPSAKDELTGWTVKLSAEGYEPETIAVGPVMEPKRGDVTVYLVFHASLRKAREARGR